MKYPKIFSTKPYQKPSAKKFILAVKLGRMKVIDEILEDEGRYVIHDFDHVKKCLYLNDLKSS